MSDDSSLSKVAETFENIYKERRRTLEDVLQKFREAREKMNREYSSRRHEATKHSTLKAVKLKKKVTIDARGPDSDSLEEQPIVSDYKVEESDECRYKVQNLVTYKESSLMKKFKKYK